MKARYHLIFSMTVSLSMLLLSACSNENATAPRQTIPPAATITVEPAEESQSEGKKEDDVSGEISDEISGMRAMGLEHIIHKLVNNVRLEQGMPYLGWDYELNLIASNYSKLMGTQGFFSHEGPDGMMANSRVKEAGFICEIRVGNMLYTVGENLGKVSVYEGYTYNKETGEVIDYDFRTDQEIAKSVLSAWMNSPGHRENLLKEFWGVEGIGVFMTEDGLVIVTQLFC